MVLYGELCPLSRLSGVGNYRFDRPAENGEIGIPQKVRSHVSNHTRHSRFLLL